jgi:predicted Zn-dependent protease
MAGRYHNRMPMIRWLFLSVALLAHGTSMAQAPLPDLGGAGDAVLSPQLERRLGENLVREIRFRDPAYVDDPEIAEYLGSLGARLAQAMPGGRHDYEFFVMREPTVNAFAMPGGFVGVHTGLIVASETESELASVLAHEIAHVSQRHIARMFGQQQQMQMPMMVALAAALLLGQSRPDLATGAAAAVQAGAVQTQLSYSRDFEREADRVGLRALEDAGLDSRAMASFFEKLQRTTRVSDDGTVPGYLRSHPVTTERIAEAQNRAANLPYRQYVDSLDFHIVRAKLRSQAGEVADAVSHFERAVREKRYARESAARYGLASALLRAGRAPQAAAEIGRLRAAGGTGPMVESLAVRVKLAQRAREDAAAMLAEARRRYPHSRPLLYQQAEVLQALGRHEQALEAVGQALRAHPGDARLHRLRAQSYAETGKRLLQHQSQAEYYALQGSIPAAIEQLQLARSAGDGDFYQLSVIEARLRELRAEHSAQAAGGSK